MTEDQIHQWVMSRPRLFVASLMGRVRHVRRLENDIPRAPYANKQEIQEAARRAASIRGQARAYLDGGLTADGQDVHTDVLNSYMTEIIFGWRSKEF